MHDHDEHTHADDIHPAQRPVEPDHPMMLDGGVIDGDTAFMVRCMVEELILMGMPFAEVCEKSRDPNYQGLYAARASLGDEQVDALLEEVAKRIGAHSRRVAEAAGQSHSATLTINAGTDTTPSNGA